MAATGLVISVFLLVVGLRTKHLLQCLIAGAAALLQAYVSVAALSSGAVVGSAAALICVVLLFALRPAGRAVRSVALAVFGAAAVSAAVIFQLAGGALLQWLAATFDKDPTLTGRTYLWFRARDLIADSPILGKGFGAFWQQGNLDAEGLWRFAQIATRQGFNFHNTLYDTLVSLGWLGAIVLGITFVLGLAAASISYVRRPTWMACFWLSMAAYLFIRMPTECVGLNEFYFSTVLLFAFLGSARVIPAPERPAAYGPVFAARFGRAGQAVSAQVPPAAARFGAR
jgi:exopolysaccharide production protein ExoQ